jgi:addiction module HigA family antidote
VLYEKFMKPARMSQNTLAKYMGVSPSMINEIVKHGRRITPSTAIKLAIIFKNRPVFWLNLQIAKDVHEIESKGFNCQPRSTDNV